MRKVYHNGGDLSAREDMSLCSLFGGMALANSKLVRCLYQKVNQKGGVHGFAGVIGGIFKGARHGAVCAALLPYVIRVNVKALQERDPTSVYLKK